MKKLLSVMLAMAIALGLLAATPMTADANPIVIQDLGIVNAGVGWTYNPATNTITLTSDVSIEGTKTTGVTQTLNITGPHLVYWEAVYAGSVDPLIRIDEDVVLTGGAITAASGVALEAEGIGVIGTVTVSNNGGARPAIIIRGVAGVAFLNTGQPGKLTVNGNVEVNTDGGVYAWDGSEITINGNVAFTAVNVALGNAIGAMGVGGILTVNGSVSFADTSGNNLLYVAAQDGGKTYIAGAITGNPVIEIDGNDKVLGKPTTANGLEYKGYYWDVYTVAGMSPQSYVYHRRGRIPSSSGCNAGVSVFGLLVLSLLAIRKRGK